MKGGLLDLSEQVRSCLGHISSHEIRGDLGSLAVGQEQKRRKGVNKSRRRTCGGKPRVGACPFAYHASDIIRRKTYSPRPDSQLPNCCFQCRGKGDFLIDVEKHVHKVSENAE